MAVGVCHKATKSWAERPPGGTSMERDAVAFLLGIYVDGGEFNGTKVYRSPGVRIL